jgi:hypothetical protein
VLGQLRWRCVAIANVIPVRKQFRHGRVQRLPEFLAARLERNCEHLFMLEEWEYEQYTLAHNY